MSEKLAESAILIRKPSFPLVYAAEKQIYRQGDLVSSWFELKRGVVRSCCYLPDGDRHITAFYFPGDVFGVDEQVREESAEAVTHVELVRHDRFADPCYEQPDWRSALRTVRNGIQVLGRRTAEQRVAAFLLMLSQRIGDSLVIPVPMSRTDIADHLRVTVHTASRTIAQLCRRRILAMSGPQRVVIVDLPGLQSAAGVR